MYYHDDTVFLTLTYDDDNLPIDQSLNKEHLQRFVKRLRKYFDDRRIKYFASGEYGEKNGRPHYHAIIFGLSFDDLKCYSPNRKNYASTIIETIWPYGNNVIGTFTYQSARYVADYIQKDDRTEMYDGRYPPFSLKSQGIGRQFALDNADYIKQNMNITLNGVPVGIPRYYQKVLDIERDYFVEKAKERSRENDDLYYQRSKIAKTTSFKERDKALKQSDENIKSRLNLKKKGRF